jgi:hypothetical protein
VRLPFVYGSDGDRKLQKVTDCHSSDAKSRDLFLQS